MKRLLVWVVAALALSGCKTKSPSAIDPFVGRTRIPAPLTGAAAGGPADPYFRGAPAPMRRPNSLAPLQSAPPWAPSTSAPPAGSGAAPGYAPQGGFNYEGNSAPSGTQQAPSFVVPPTRTGASRGWSTPGAKAATEENGRSSENAPLVANRTDAQTPPARERVIRVLQPRHSGAPRSLATSSPDEPRRLNVPTDATDIMDLPGARASQSPGHTHSTSPSSGFRLVSGTDDPDGSSAVAAAVGTSTPASEASARARYGHGPAHEWLRGRLEYSQIDRRWKLRYIPVDGKTDQYGGSVVVSDPSKLTGCERGDFVEVRGRVGEEAPEKGYAPTYEVAEVQHLAKDHR